VLGACSLGLMTPSLWKGQILSYINGKIPSGQISADKFKGHILTSIKIENLIYNSNSGIEIKVIEIDIDLDLVETLFSQLSLKKLSFDGITTSIISDGVISAGKVQTDNAEKYFVLSDLPEINIDQVILNGTIITENENLIKIIALEFDGSVLSNNRVVKIDIASIRAGFGDLENVVLIDNGEINVFKGHTEIRAFNGIVNELVVAGNIDIPYSSNPMVKADMTIEMLDSLKLLKNFPFRSLDLNMVLENKELQGSIALSDDSGKTIDGTFQVKKYPEYLKIEKVSLFHESSKINLQGVIETSGRVGGRAEISNLNILPWIPFDRPTNIDGLIFFESEYLNNSIGNTVLTVELMEDEISNQDIVAVSGTVVYYDSVLTITEPVMVEFGSSLAIAKGEIDWNSNHLDLDLELTKADVKILNNFLDDPIDNGVFTGQLNVDGLINSPNVEMVLSGEKVRFKDFYLESVSTNSKILKNNEIQTAVIQLDFGKGTWKEYGFNQGSADIKIDSNLILFKNIYFNKDDDYVQLDASLEAGKELNISSIQMAYKGHYFVNPEPLAITLDAGTKFSIKPFVLHVDDGIMEGEIVFKEKAKGHLKLTNIDANIFHPFISDDRFKVEGNIFGELQTYDVGTVQNFTLEASLKNGKIQQWEFDDFIISIAYNNGILNIDELVLTKGDFTGFEMTGIIPVEKDTIIDQRINIQSSYRNFDSNIISSLILPNFFHLGGITSGKLDISGTLGNTKIDFDLSSQDAEFDILNLGTFKAVGNYDGKQLNLNHISSKSNNNYISGSGFVPFDFNVGSQRFGRFFDNDPIFLDLKGKTFNMPFLTRYIAEVDSIPGEFDINLILKGPMSNLVREGSVEITNADIYSTLLDEPIRKVYASADLKNNLLSINSFNSIMVNPSKREKDGEATITGTIDLKKFFEPRFNLHVSGKNTYFRTVTGDLEGLVDLDLVISGKDTISIAGDIPVQDVKMYQEFSLSAIETMQNPDAKIKMDYRINFPIDGEFRLINSQVDARMRGEISMTQFGTLDSDYRGELFITSGKFYYYGDVFTINDGYLALDKKGFNPYLDIHANTTIDDEEILINLVGDMDNPQLILSSSSGFSQSDILELLTWRKRFEDQEMSSSGFGTQAQALFGVWFESQLEKNLLQMTGLKKLGLVEDVSISGTSTLLNPSTDTDVSIKAELTNKLAINYAYKRSFSLGNPENSMLGVELKLNRYVSLVANVDKTGNFHVKYRLRYSY